MTSIRRDSHWIDGLASLHGKRVLDVGCGGGVLTEAMAHKSDFVLGIDLADKPLKVAQLHALESRVRVDYRDCAAETLAAEQPASFDVVTCMEMLEHVPDPAANGAGMRHVEQARRLGVFFDDQSQREGIRAGDRRRGVRFESAAARYARVRQAD